MPGDVKSAESDPEHIRASKGSNTESHTAKNVLVLGCGNGCIFCEIPKTVTAGEINHVVIDGRTPCSDVLVGLEGYFNSVLTEDYSVWKRLVGEDRDWSQDASWEFLPQILFNESTEAGCELFHTGEPCPAEGKPLLCKEPWVQLSCSVKRSEEIVCVTSGLDSWTCSDLRKKAKP
ncbi:hypothetical protein U0070_015258 [Myodes glareolus]|uniref:Uncharacterized protein n=1 Tax=Myodes glareolus TaxID=447135 RepID=A0AAW0K0U9_MYOGA